MRVVIDGLPISDDDNLGRIVSRLLQVWSPPHATDELHLVVGADTQIVIPDWVVVHQLGAGHLGAFGRLYARAFGLRRLSRSLKAQVLLGLRPTKVITSVSCPRGTIGYNLWRQPGAEQFSGTALVEPEAGIAWSRFAHRLRLSMVDAIADRDWHARRFKIHPALLWSRPSAANVARFALPPRRSLRWIAAVSTSTLALSAAAAASVDLVASHSFPIVTPPHVTPPANSHPGGVGGGASSGDVPLPAPTTTSSTPSTTSTTPPTSVLGTKAPVTSTTSSGLGQTGSTPGLGITGVPGLTLPVVTLPTIPPSLPLPKISCTTSGTTTSSAPSILSLCNLHVNGLPLGSK
jgi:hypothetical protein